MARFDLAEKLLREFKGADYLHGMGVLPRVGGVAAKLGRRAVLISNRISSMDPCVRQIEESIRSHGVELVGESAGAAPNSPYEDVFRIADFLRQHKPDAIVSFGGGSTIDAVKAAEVLRALGGDVDNYFGVGLVTPALAKTGRRLTPHVAIQTAAGSGAHLTKYSNITNTATMQKKLIVDTAIVPARPVFDYALTFTAPAALTSDGGVDGLAHSIEVLYSAVGKPEYDRIEAVAAESIALVLEYLPRALRHPSDSEAREALGLATDLGGYAIMIGSTNGGHLTSFSLVDILNHGRACGIMNPYYTVFFAPAIQRPLRVVASIFSAAGYFSGDVESLNGRRLGEAVAEAMIAFAKNLGFPSTLSEVRGFTDAHIVRALAAAKNPQLKMKLENMPIPMTAAMVDVYMKPILQAAAAGNFGPIKNVPASG